MIEQMQQSFPAEWEREQEKKHREIKENYHSLKGHTACNCTNCSRFIEEEAEKHIRTAPLDQQTFITKEILIADLTTMHADKRRKEILEAKTKPKKSKKFF